MHWHWKQVNEGVCSVLALPSNQITIAAKTEPLFAHMYTSTAEMVGVQKHFH